jgi:hypothetical protein
MDGAPGRNPLGPVVAAFVITLPFDYDAYLIHRDLSEFGILIIVIKAVFAVPLVLYQWRVRERYFRYVQNRHANLSAH